MLNIVNKDSLKYEVAWAVGMPVPEKLMNAKADERIVLDITGPELKMLIKAMQTEHEMRAGA